MNVLLSLILAAKRGQNSPTAVCLLIPVCGFCIWQQPACFSLGEHVSFLPLQVSAITHTKNESEKNIFFLHLKI